MYSTSNSRFTEINEFGGIFGVTTSTLIIQLFPVGLLLRLLSEAVRCLLYEKSLCFPIQGLVYSLLF